VAELAAVKGVSQALAAAIVAARPYAGLDDLVKAKGMGEKLLAKLRPLYGELRQMDLQLSKLWELFTDGQRPAEPPVYWNMEGPIFDADQAKTAIRLEMAMARAKYRAAEGDALAKAAAMVEAMLGL